jgi:hypothetical protein
MSDIGLKVKLSILACVHCCTYRVHEPLVGADIVLLDASSLFTLVLLCTEPIVTSFSVRPNDVLKLISLNREKGLDYICMGNTLLSDYVRACAHFVHLN